MVEQLRALDVQVAQLDGDIIQRAKENEVARRLMTIPASALSPRQHSSHLPPRQKHSGEDEILRPGSG